jgi:beta-galactosidase
VDVLPVEADLHDYKLVVAPSLHLLTDESALRLLNYVYSGGHLLLGPRSGMKDKHNALHPMRQPGVLAEALGAYVEEYYALAEPVTTSGILGNGSASIWAEWLHVTALDADVLLRYGAHSWLDGQPAIVSRRVKKGRITLVGAWLDDGLMVTLMEWACREILPIFGSLPRGIEVGRRVGNGRVLYVVINHTDKQQSVPLREIYLNLLDGQQYVGALEISAQGIVLLTPT